MTQSFLRKIGDTSIILPVRIKDIACTATTNPEAGLTGLTFGSITAYYQRDLDAAPVAIALVDMTLPTWASGGFKEASAGNTPGLYMLGVPNAAFASGAKSVMIVLKGAASMAPAWLQVQLVNFELNGATSGIDANVIAMAANTVTASAIADNAIDAGAFAADAITAAKVAADVGTELADALLKRDLSAVTGEAARSPINALRRLRNHVAASGGTLTVKKEDDTTTAWTAALTTDAAAIPVVTVDPA
jgi:hypothetical protein